MVMKPYAKTILRSIRMTLPRFIAIFAIIALGVGFFAGLKVTTPSFVHTADVYTNEYAMFDFKFLSTIGFEQEDIDEIAKRTNCIVEGSYTADCAAFLGDTVSADTVRFLSITKNVNKLKLESGRMPEKPDEIVIDGYKVSSARIGDKLIIADETSESARNMFKYKEYTVVGTARTPVYMNFQRGTSDEGSGTVSYFVCALPEAFDSEYYTEAYLYANTGLYIYSDEYKEWAKGAESQYGDIVDDIIGKRFEKLLKDEYQKLYDGFDEFNEEIGDAWDEIADGQKELDDGRKELEDAQKEINDNRKKLADAKKTLDSSSKKLKDANNDIKIIDNQSVKNILNKSKEPSWVFIDLTLSSSEPLDEIEAMLERELPKIPDRVPQIIEGPYYGGIGKIGSHTITISVGALGHQSDTHEIKIALNRILYELFRENGINL